VIFAVLEEKIFILNIKILEIDKKEKNVSSKKVLNLYNAMLFYYL